MPSQSTPRFALPFIPYTQAELTCEHCARRFLVGKDELASRRYCSRPCEYAAKRTRYKPFPQRFWALVAKSPDPDACWLWEGALDHGGYGMVTIPRLLMWNRSRAVRAHLVAWRLTHGAIPAGLSICHRCDVRHCVRPDHLFLGTARDNQRDAIEKGRNARGERNGMSALTDAGALEIRRLGAAREVTQKEIARRFGVSLATVEKILGRRAWKHV